MFPESRQRQAVSAAHLRRRGRSRQDAVDENVHGTRKSLRRIEHGAEGRASLATRWRVAAWSLGLVAVMLGGWMLLRSGRTGIGAERPPYLVGAYYYTWYYGGHWASTDFAGRHLAAPLEPQLGEYVSDDPAVIATHRIPILHLTTRTLILQNGRLAVDGPRDAVLAHLAKAGA